MNPPPDKCPKCGATLAGGLCRPCLLLAGLDTAPGSICAWETPAATANSGPPPPEKAGDRIDRYKLLQQIGEGGFGVVWMAEQEEPVRRRVALKIIKMGMDTKEVLARFEQEQQALAMMDHPNIARVFDAGATKWGRPFFVMELIRGIRITDYCDQNTLPTVERLKLFMAVCHAIQHAHQKGIIHRDLKPSNILVTLHDGTPVPKVIDFGVAKAMQQQRLTDLTLFTQFEQMVGTPLYMSPEQAEMSGLDIDTRSDIYSLGVLLYELLTGRTPFDPKELMQQGVDEIRRTIREEEPPAPSVFVHSMAADLSTTVARHRQADAAKLVGEIRGDLDWIVMKALEKDRTRRYETANGLAKDIERHLASEPVLARPASRLYLFGRMVKRHKLSFAASAAVTVALLLALGILVLSNARIRSEQNQKGAALVAAQASAHDAREQLFVALFNQARAARFSGRMGQRLDSLQALAEAARIHPEERLRDEATVAMALPDVRLGSSWHLELNEVVDESYHFSATPGLDGTIIVRSVPDRRELRRIESRQKTVGLAFNRNGRFLAQYTTNGSWNIWRWEDGHSVLRDGSRLGGAIAFSPNDHYVAMPRDDFVLNFSLDTGAEENRFRARALVHNLVFHPDSRRIAVGYDSFDVTSVYDTADGKNLADLPVGALVNQVTAWHPDGIRLAVAGRTPPVQIWDVEAKVKVAVMEGNSEEVDRLSFHPDGEMLASVGWESICRVWQPSSGRLLMQFQSRIPFLFSTDGRWLGTYGTGEQGRLLEVASCPEYRTLENRRETGENPYLDGDASPDGRLFALGMNDGVGLWSTSDWRQLAFLPTGCTSTVLFLPNGSELLTCGDSGLQRWPMKIDRQISSTIQLGPPTRIALPFTPTRAARSQDGKTIAAISLSGGGAVLVDLSTGSVRSPLMRHDRGQFVALSPDGQWMASSAWGTYQVCLWTASNGKMVHEFPGENASAAFHNDGKTLFTASYDGISFWDVPSQKLLHKVHGDVETTQHHMAFSPDGKLVAVALTPTVIYLLDTSNARTVAKLEDPHGDRPTWIGFTPDGTQLLTAASLDRAVHVWDLRAIRTRLEGMGLDWDWPEFSPASESNEGLSTTGNAIRRIEVLGQRPPVEKGR